MLLGEGTFHQVHGGIATNAKVPMRDVFQDEFENIRGVRYRPPAVQPFYFGRPNQYCRESFIESINSLQKLEA